VRADTRWNNLNTAFNNYLAYIAKKRPRLSLSYVDLLYVSNLKGGNSSIIDDAAEVDDRLKRYSAELKRINKTTIGDKQLGTLTELQLDAFIKFADTFIQLPLRPDIRIRGFGASYASALLAAHFPALAPILDRNVLAGADISYRRTKQKQVIHIESYYAELIRRLHRWQKDTRQSLREVDHDFFVAGSGKLADK
jgi:hypothetical protein